MKRIQGKVLAIVASVLSTLFSFILFIIALIVKLIVNNPDFQSTTRDGLRLNNPNLSTDEIAAFSTYSPFTIMTNFFLIGTVIFLILSLTALILSIKANHKNKVLVGASLIVIGVLHLLFSRMLSGILMLIAGILILSDREPGTESTRKLKVPDQLLNNEKESPTEYTMSHSGPYSDVLDESEPSTETEYEQDTNRMDSE